MSLAGFQRALADLVASPALCLEALTLGSIPLDGYNINERERRRLLHALRQPGMAANCTLYRANRLSPLHGALPLTCMLLREHLRELVDEFWSRAPARDLQHLTESARFAAFLREKSHAGLLNEPHIEAILAFELALGELRFLPRGRILDQLGAAARSGFDGICRAHPLVRVVRFQQSPVDLIEALTASASPPTTDPGEYYAVLVGTREDVELRMVLPKLGRLLVVLQSGETVALIAPGAAELLRTGLAVDFACALSASQPLDR